MSHGNLPTLAAKSAGVKPASSQVDSRDDGHLDSKSLEPNGRATESNQLFVWHYLRPVLPGLLLATIASLLLALISTMIGSLVGPCIQVIAAPQGAMFGLRTLLGERLGAFAEQFLGLTTVDAQSLLVKIPAALAVLALVKMVATASQWFLFERAGELASLAVRRDLVDSYLRLSPNVRKRETSQKAEASLSSAITTDVRLFREYIVHYYGGLPRELLEALFMTVTMVLLSPRLTLVFFVAILPAALILAQVGKTLRRRAAKALADYSDLSEWLQQRLLGVETIKHYQTEGVELRKMQELSATLSEKFARASRVKARSAPLLQGVAVAALTTVLALALYQVHQGSASGAVQMSFLTSLALLSNAAGKLGRYLNTNREAAAAIDRLRHCLVTLLDARQVQVLLPSAKGAVMVQCRGLEVKYEGSERAALAGVDLTFTGGRIYCIAGPSGAGKSTIFNALLGLVKLQSGEIKISGEHRGDSLLINYMPQKVLLAPESIAANVAYPSASVDRERVTEALEKVEMGDVVRQLDLGIDTKVGDGGLGLSGGQAQRILLARLWYSQSPVVLVDEGTSALDPEVERTVHKLLRDLAARGAIVVTIAHRPSSAEIADELLVMEAGRLVLRGRPEEVRRAHDFGRLFH